MRIGIIQPCFIPWRGYFDLISNVDLFIFHDDIQYTKQDWRNRNRIKCRYGARWLTVPILSSSANQLICNTKIANSIDWGAKHMNLWKENYSIAPFYNEVIDLLCLEMAGTFDKISDLNIFLIRRICAFLAIDTPMITSSELTPIGSGTSRLINIIKSCGGSTYLSGPAADGYLDKAEFNKSSIVLEYKSYDYVPYPQLWGEFVGDVTVLDLIANCGKEAISHLKSRSANQRVS
jgi:hypothetical protein